MKNVRDNREGAETQRKCWKINEVL